MSVLFIPAHSTNYTEGRTSCIDRIVIHYTAGDGDTAENNGRYFQGLNRKSSAHYFVDERGAVQSVKDIDTAWHAGNWQMNCRSVGVEMCSKKDESGRYYIPEKTIKNTVALVRELMEKYSIPVSAVIRHYDVNGKHCPEPFVRDESLWKTFVLELGKECDGQEQKVAEWAREAWTQAKEKNVMDGTRPTDTLTRQELAVVLWRLNLI